MGTAYEMSPRKQMRIGRDMAKMVGTIFSTLAYLARFWVVLAVFVLILMGNR